MHHMALLIVGFHIIFNHIHSSWIGSLTSGTPVFGSAAAASAPSTAVTTAPPAAPSIAAAADTTSSEL